MSLFTPPEEQIRLRVGGRELSGWLEASVSLSLENAQRGFTVRAASRYPEEIHLLRIKPGSEVVVYAGADRVLTGWIDKQEAAFDRGSHALTISGRSKTCDLVDCSVVDVAGQWRNVRAEAIIRELSAAYGVDVVVEIPATDPIRRFATQKGETVMGAIQRLAQLRSFLITDDAQGRLVLTRAGATRAAVDLRTGANIKSGSASVDLSARFTEYRCRSSAIGNDQDFGAILQSVQTATDAGDMGRRRVLEIRAERGEDAARTRQRATWEAATRYGQSIAAAYVVQGWRQTEGGPLWERNQILRVVDTLTGLDGDLLVVDVDLSVTRDAGTVASLTLAPPEGYEALEPFERRTRPGRRRVRNALEEALEDGVTLTPAGEP